MDELDPTDTGLDGATDIGSGSAVAPGDNPSNGLDANALLSQLIGGATQVATAANTAQPVIYSAPAASTPLASITAVTGLSSTMIVVIGVAFVFLIALRK